MIEIPKDPIREIQELRRSNAQDRTDIQRLWKLLKRQRPMAAAAPWGINAEEESSSSSSSANFPCDGCAANGPFVATITKIYGSGNPWINDYLGTSHTVGNQNSSYSNVPYGWLSNCREYPDANPALSRYSRIEVGCSVSGLDPDGQVFVLLRDYGQGSIAQTRCNDGLNSLFLSVTFTIDKVFTCSPFYFYAKGQNNGFFQYEIEITE